MDSHLVQIAVSEMVGPDVKDWTDSSHRATAAESEDKTECVVMLK